MTEHREAPAGVCAYAPEDSPICGAPAVYHFLVIGDTMTFGRFSCRAHSLSAADGAADYHRVGEVCGQPGTKWVARHVPGEGFCYDEDDAHHHAVADLTLTLGAPA